jgi:protein phosphatase
VAALADALRRKADMKTDPTDLRRPPLPRAALVSDQGRVRSQNQDACLVDPERRLFAVADGMGGHKAGDVAAWLAIRNLPDLIDTAREKAGSGSVQAAVEQAVIQLSELVHAESLDDEDLEGMGTTLVLALVDDGTALIVHVGDSRAYLLRNGELGMLTADHCVAAELIRLGMNPQEAAEHPHGHRLTQAIGIATRVRPSFAEVEAEAGDRLLLCSDGLTNMIDDVQISAILASEPDAQKAGQKLVDAANEAGGRDNISVVVVDFEAQEG